MVFVLFISIFFISINCFPLDGAIINGDIVPQCGETAHVIEYSNTRNLDNGSLKPSLLRQLNRAFGIQSFIETGTYLGDTTAQAAQIFDSVHTIELSEELAFRACQRFQNSENVIVHQGNSGKILFALLSHIENRILFYLDGHYSGHVTAKDQLFTPILDELKAIERAQKNDSVILIDDIRLFQDSCFPEKCRKLNLGLETYPDLREVIAALLHINQNYQICFLGDALLAFPGDQNVSVSPVVRACALHRLERLCTDLSEEELNHADLVVSKAMFDEKKEIRIYYETYSSFELEYGYRSYACLWYGLLLYGEGDIEGARQIFKKTSECSLPDWHIHQLHERL